MVVWFCFLSLALGGDLTRVNRISQGLVILLGLVGVGEGEIGQGLGQAVHDPGASVGGGLGHFAVGLVAETVGPAGDHGAGNQAFEIPLPRSGMGLVKVVDVEDELTLWRGEDAEVRQMGVAA